jgi:ABC-type branched-subunit amino acid transport system substrate-binding protein
MFRQFSAILVFISLLPLTVCAQATKIGIILRLNDNYVDYPKAMLKAMQFALKEAPSKISLDTKIFSHDGSPDGIERSIKECQKYAPEIVIGGETSQVAMVIAKAFKDKIFITPTASSTRLLEVHPAPIRMIHPDEQYYQIAEYVIKKNKFKNIGMLHNISYPNTDAIGKSVAQYLTQQGINFQKVITQSGEEITAKKLSPLIENKVEAVIAFVFETDLRNTYKILKDKNIHPIYIGADSWGQDQTLVENVLSPKDSKFRGVRSSYWNPDRKDNFFVEKKNALEKYLGTTPDAFHAIGYDTMKLILVNLGQVKTIKEFIPNIKTQKHEGFLTTEKYEFNPELAPLKDFHLYEYQKSGITYYGKVER